MPGSSCSATCSETRNTLSREFQSQTSFVSTNKSAVFSSCRICLSHILDPAVLTCGHKFCERCLYQYWDQRDKPEFIVCPLCRSNAYKVDFAKKEASSTTDDFRNTFNLVPKLSNTQIGVHSIRTFCLKLSLLIPLFYCVLNWVHLPLDLLMWTWHFLVNMEYKL